MTPSRPGRRPAVPPWQAPAVPVPDERVILVDEEDRALGWDSKQRVHTHPRLHRAFSIFVLNDRGHVLLQRRAFGKYHSGGLWSNACCGHPRPGEATEAAARRRLWEELAVPAALTHRFHFIYRAEVGGGLVEHELDHVFTARWNGSPCPDPAEVADWCWMAPAVLDRELRLRPHQFSAWLGPAWRRLRESEGA